MARQVAVQTEAGFVVKERGQAKRERSRGGMERGPAVEVKAKVQPTKAATPAATPAVQPKPRPAVNVARDNPNTRANKAFVITQGRCLCGCGGSVNRGRFFNQGHDARAKGMVTRVQKGEASAESLPAILRATLPLWTTCGCCGQQLLVGRSECDHSRCTCAQRKAIAKPHKPTATERKHEQELEVLAESVS